MTKDNFKTRLRSAIGEGIGLCIGLDPVLERIPENVRTASEPLYAFNCEIIEKTHDIAAAYKPNLAFYEAWGAEGWRQLEKTIHAIPEKCIVIADGKRGDIGSTAKAYASAIFEKLECDAVTVNPYLGSDAVQPFLEKTEKGVFLLAVTSNPGGADLQELQCEDKPLFQHVIMLARRMSGLDNVGLVIGATKPELWHTVLETAEDLPLLVPGVGAQGGDIAILRSALSDYPAPVLVNASRSIIYASNATDFSRMARDAAISLLDKLKLR